jgi:hypothetical protein
MAKKSKAATERESKLKSLTFDLDEIEGLINSYKAKQGSAYVLESLQRIETEIRFKMSDLVRVTTNS